VKGWVRMRQSQRFVDAVLLDHESENNKLRCNEVIKRHRTVRSAEAGSCGAATASAAAPASATRRPASTRCGASALGERSAALSAFVGRTRV
jgi:hypothetical protein